MLHDVCPSVRRDLNMERKTRVGETHTASANDVPSLDELQSCDHVDRKKKHDSDHEKLTVGEPNLKNYARPVRGFQGHAVARMAGEIALHWDFIDMR